MTNALTKESICQPFFQTKAIPVPIYPVHFFSRCQGRGNESEKFKNI